MEEEQPEVTHTAFLWKPLEAPWAILKCWYPTTMGFPTKNDHFGVFGGDHHLRKPPHVFQIWRLSLSRLDKLETIMQTILECISFKLSPKKKLSESNKNNKLVSLSQFWVIPSLQNCRNPIGSFSENGLVEPIYFAFR